MLETTRVAGGNDGALEDLRERRVNLVTHVETTRVAGGADGAGRLQHEASARPDRVGQHSERTSERVLSLLALPVQKYKY